MIKNNSHIRPYLKWAGGKRQLLPEIKKHLPSNIHNYTYYEPFAGAGAVFFELQPPNAVINDSNAQLMLTYNVIKHHVEELIALLNIHKQMNDADYYYEIRNRDRDTQKFNALTNAEKAARLIYLNKTCYNGLYRVNSHGFFNVPYGRYKNPAICEDTLLRCISGYLNANKIKILNNDFEDAVSGADAHSFIYCDPPYHSPEKAGFTGYQAAGFNEDDQKRLYNVILAMTQRGVKCLLSNADTAFIRKLYHDDCFNIIPVQAKRLINSNSAGRGKTGEVLIKNWKDW